MHDHLLIFLPGIMGSELIRTFPRSPGRQESVWGYDFVLTLYFLSKGAIAVRPNDGIVAGKVIRRMKTPPGTCDVEVYEPLLNYLVKDLGYTEEVDLLPFGYDWRKDLSVTAAQLADELRNRLSGRHLKIVAHSMGGLLARLMLADVNNSDLVKATQCFVQIGSPVGGSSEAFYTLRREPVFRAFLDALKKMYFRVDSGKLALLREQLNSCDAMYQLLPPQTEKILQTPDRTDHSALDPEVWPQQHLSSVIRAGQVHRNLTGVPTVKMKVVYSMGINTDHLYSVNEYFQLPEQRSPRSVGDGTVTVGSAIHNAPPHSLYCTKKYIQHDKLPNHPEIFDLLRTELA